MERKIIFVGKLLRTFSQQAIAIKQTIMTTRAIQYRILERNVNCRSGS
jgi:hypothetical protein